MGYRIDASFNAAATDWTPGLGGVAGSPGSGTMLDHGPFVRLAYNFAAPPSGARPADPAPPPPAPPVAARRSYMVFFDFDRAAITSTGAAIVKQAATDAKAGAVTRVEVTGHTDSAGGDTYNRALSLRRAEAVKARLIGEGVPAGQITVVGRASA